MKKLTNYLNILLTLTLLQACSSVAETPYKTANDETTLIGHYIYGHEVNTFQPCGDVKVFWVEGTNNMLELLEVSHRKYVSEPYEEVFVEIIGRFVTKANDGFASDYDGKIQVETLLLMRKKSQTGCR
jgi:hypothetical protein